MTRALKTAALLVVATTLCAGACKKEGPKPTQAFETWLQAVEKCDATAMRAGMTKTSIDQVEQLMKQLQAFVPEEKRGKFDLLTELCKGYRKGAIVVTGETVNGTQAMLKLTSDGKPIEAPMSFEDNAWKLDFAALMKESLAAATGARIPSTPAPAAPDPAAPPAPATPSASPAPSPAPATTP